MGPHLAGREEEALTLLFESTQCRFPLRRAGPHRLIGPRSAWGRFLGASITRLPHRLECGRVKDFLSILMTRPCIFVVGRSNSLEFSTTFPDRVIPVLLEAFDSFREFDPDFTYNGEHERDLYGPRRVWPRPQRLSHYG